MTSPSRCAWARLREATAWWRCGSKSAPTRSIGVDAALRSRSVQLPWISSTPLRYDLGALVARARRRSARSKSSTTAAGRRRTRSAAARRPSRAARARRACGSCRTRPSCAAAGRAARRAPRSACASSSAPAALRLGRVCGGRRPWSTAVVGVDVGLSTSIDSASVLEAAACGRLNCAPSASPTARAALSTTPMARE